MTKQKVMQYILANRDVSTNRLVEKFHLSRVVVSVLPNGIEKVDYVLPNGEVATSAYE